MRLRDLFTLRKSASTRSAEAQATEDRILAPLDALVIEAGRVLGHYRESLPHVFDDRRNRRAGDRATDITCERAEPRLPPFELGHKCGANRGGAL